MKEIYFTTFDSFHFIFKFYPHAIGKLKRFEGEKRRKEKLEERCDKLGDKKRKNRRKEDSVCMLDTLRIYFFQPRPTQCPGRNSELY